MSVREVVVTLPAIRLERGQPPCAECSYDADEGRHTTTPDECSGFVGAPGCPEPSAHHKYRARPWWRRFRRAQGGWW